VGEEELGSEERIEEHDGCKDDNKGIYSKEDDENECNYKKEDKDTEEEVLMLVTESMFFFFSLRIFSRKQPLDLELDALVA
jgi:hypothetical protein